MELDGSSCCCEMPTEVMIEILTYLPVKSLIRFTCVCKSWLHLIKTDAQFAIRNYLVRNRTTSSAKLMENVIYLVDQCGRVTKDEVVVWRFCMYSITEKKTFRILNKLELGPALNDVTLFNICHGIMCIYVSTPSTTRKIFLCNPTIREVVPVPVSTSHKTLSYIVFNIGLGFDPTSGDYKVVEIVSPVGQQSCRVDVYCVRKNHWHSVNSIGPLEKFETLTSYPVVNANGRILNWLGYLKSDGRQSLHSLSTGIQGILSFDIVDEIFRKTSLPNSPYGLSEYHMLPSSRCEACLCCSYSIGHVRDIENSSGIDIWTLHEDLDHEQQRMWSKQYTIRFHYPNQDIVVQPTNLWMNDNELLVNVIRKGSDSEEVFHYDLETEQLKRTGRQGMLMNPFAYTESLVSIRGVFMSSCSDEVSARDDNSSSKQDTLDQGNSKANDGGSIYFVREVARRNSEVRWSYSFK